ncbi:hypothetical protein ACPPVO_46025 [Dactylosporangium sp. McL0621]|uniref:hypothetical protein n=1 Tax=Dactylosporangium sp. McL0621 TaxID=3415678 RepID=UPI003CF4A8E5
MYYPQPPPKKTNTALIVSLAVGIPVLLILCCVGVFIVGPVLGIGFLTSKVVKDEAQLKVVAGDWSNADGSVRADITEYGSVTVTFTAPLTTGSCTGYLKAAKPRYPVTFASVPCGPVTGTAGVFQRNDSGTELTLTAPGLTGVVLHQ